MRRNENERRKIEVLENQLVNLNKKYERTQESLNKSLLRGAILGAALAITATLPSKLLISFFGRNFSDETVRSFLLAVVAIVALVYVIFLVLLFRRSLSLKTEVSETRKQLNIEIGQLKD